MAAAAAASCHHALLVLRYRSQPPSPSPSPSPSQSQSPSSSFISFLKPFFVSSSNSLSIVGLRQIHVPPLRKPLFPSLFSSSSSSHSFHHTPPLVSAAVGGSAQKSIEYDSGDDALEEYDEETEVANDELETGRGNVEDEDTGADSTSSPLERKREERVKLEVPSLTVKERKELASYAHSLGKKLKSQLVGKSGVTSSVATSFIETLEANELLKIKIHRSCPGELDDVVKQLEEVTGSVTVGQIGRTLILYRPSLSKLKAEEKKKQVRKLVLKKQHKPKLANKQEQIPKLSRRGSSWKMRGSM